MQNPLREFKESQEFKEMVRKQVFQYVKEQLPLLIKEIVQEEIKNIVGD